MSKDEVHGVVAENGDIIVPSSELDDLKLVPGQRVPLRMQHTWTRKKRRDLYGVMAGKATPVTREEIKEVSREAWGDWV